MKKVLLSIIIALILASGGYYYNIKKSPLVINLKPADFSVTVYNSATPTPQVSSDSLSQSTTIPNSLPKSALISVPFLVQALFGVWDPLHEDACEEASLIMVQHFLAKTNIQSSATGDTEIKNMIAYENTIGYGSSITLEQLNQIAKDYLGIKTGAVKTNITISDIKTELAAGHPVIVGAAGKILPNPYFSNGGPNYHMLVIVGYDANGFVTNDPGTKNGQGFRYSFNALYNAIHDFDSTNILNGQKSFLVFN